MKKVYLGDSVYAETDRFGALVLTTEDGIKATNTIVLEPVVLRALLAEVQADADAEEYHRHTERMAAYAKYAGPAKGPDGAS